MVTLDCKFNNLNVIFWVFYVSNIYEVWSQNMYAKKLQDVPLCEVDYYYCMYNRWV